MTNTNDRGEFTGEDGQLRHVANSEAGKFVPPLVHEGPWLTCDGCNPVVVLEPNVLEAPEIVAARARYAEAKEAADAAAETLKAATAKLKSAMTEASGGAYRAVLNVPGFRPMNLTYVESWRVDTKRLKADHPLLYVDLAERSGAWRLEQSRGK